MISGKFKIKLIVNMQSAGCVERIVEIPYPTTMRKIKELFPKYIGVQYDEDCDWECIPNSMVVTQ